MPPEVASENPTAPTISSGSGASGAAQPAVSSGTASSAMIKAAEAASSAAPSPAGTAAGDTTPQAGAGTPGATPGATGQPAVNAQPAGSQPVADQTPVHRIEAAVRNAREQTRREVEQQFSAFKGMNPEEVQTGLQILRNLQANPAQFFQELGQHLRGSQQGGEEYPEADLVSKDGQLKTYRDETLRKMLDIHGQRVMAQVMGQMKPFLDSSRAEQAQRQESAQQAAREQSIREALTEARQLPHFTKENEPAILESIQNIPEDRRRALGPVASLHLAYNTFLRDRVFPTLQSETEKKVRESFTKKANAGAGQAHPTDQGGEAQKPALRNARDLSRHLAQMEEQLTA